MAIRNIQFFKVHKLVARNISSNLKNVTPSKLAKNQSTVILTMIMILKMLSHEITKKTERFL